MTAQTPVNSNEFVIASPIPFVLMGPKHRHRRVIARSSDANLDLIGLDDRILEWSDNAPGPRPFGSVFRRNLAERTHIVRTGPDFSIEDAAEDSRLSHLSFAWRGVAIGDDVNVVSRAFKELAPDLDVAIKEKDYEALEWNIAPLILLCQRIKERREAHHEKRRVLILGFLATYVIAVLAALFQYYLVRII